MFSVIHAEKREGLGLGFSLARVYRGAWGRGYLYSICLVSTAGCDATIAQHKRNTNIQESSTLPNTLLVIVGLYVEFG